MKNNTIFQKSIKSSLKMKNETMSSVNAEGKRYTFETSSFVPTLTSEGETAILFETYYGRNKDESNSFSLTISQVNELIQLLETAKNKVVTQGYCIISAREYLNKIIEEIVNPAIYIELVDEKPAAYRDIEDSIICTYAVHVKTTFIISEGETEDDSEYEIYSRIHTDIEMEPFLINIYLSGYIPMDSGTLSKLFPTAKSIEYSTKLLKKGERMIKQKQEEAMKKLKDKTKVGRGQITNINLGGN